jgi:hypothetical protein
LVLIASCQYNRFTSTVVVIGYDWSLVLTDKFLQPHLGLQLWGGRGLSTCSQHKSLSLTEYPLEVYFLLLSGYITIGRDQLAYKVPKDNKEKRNS